MDAHVTYSGALALKEALKGARFFEDSRAPEQGLLKCEAELGCKNRASYPNAGHMMLMIALSTESDSTCIMRR